MNRRTVTSAATKATFLVALFAVLAVFGLSSVSLHAADSANTLYKRGQSAEAREDYDAAFDSYQKAYAKAPKDLRIRTALYRARIPAAALHLANGRKLLGAGDAQGALMEFIHAGEIDASNEAVQQEIAKVRTQLGAKPADTETSLDQQSGSQEALDSIGAPAMLKPVSNEPLTLHMVEDAKTIYQAIGKAAGVNVLFDPDYNSKRVQVDLNNVSLLDALRIVGTMSNTFWRPVTVNTIFVAQNSRAKRQDLEEQAVQTFYLTNAWQQNDLNDVQTALRNVMGGSAKVFAVASQNAIVMRGTPDELMLAQKLVSDLDKARPEVVVDIAILEVSKNWERTLGIAWPSSMGIQLQTPTSTTSGTTTTTCSSSSGSTTCPPTLYNLAHLNSNDFAVSVGAATANLLLTDSNTKILQNPRIRATDAQKATMKIGQRIPIATGSYQTGAATALVSSLVNTQFQYIDVGVNIEMTPTIHYDRDVTLKMKIEVSSVASESNISGVTEPIIGQHTSEQVIRLREGEVSILGGILQQQDNVSWSGIPGLSSIPLLKYLFGSKDHTITDDEIVFMLVPHVVRGQDLTPTNLRTIDTGSGQSIELRHVSSDIRIPSQAGPTPAGLPVRPPTRSSSSVGSVPGLTAEAGGMAALAQLRAAASTTGDVAAAAASHGPMPPLAPGQASPGQTGLGQPNPPQANPAQPNPTQPGQAASTPVAFVLNPPSAPVTVGATFKVPVVLLHGTDIASVPLQVQYDASKLSLVNVDNGDFLESDGKAVALVHRDDGPGAITINASRPPGAVGVNGAGVVCVLSFQAKAAGESAINITHPGAVNSAQRQVPAQGAQTTIQVR